MKTFQSFLREFEIDDDEEGGILDPFEVKTEKPMVASNSPSETMSLYAQGKMPLDGRKVRSIESAIKRGVAQPPLMINRKTGVLKDGHHRLQAYRNLGIHQVRFMYDTSPY